MKLNKQVLRGEKAAIYEARDPQHDNMLVSHEVFLLKIFPPKVAFGKPYDAYEIYPGNSAFGVSAYCIGSGADSLDRAKARFEILEKAELNIDAIDAEEDESDDDDSAE